MVVGQGGEADNQEIAMLAEKLGAEVGYSRARVMNGGVDAEKVIGISDICWHLRCVLLLALPAQQR